ncbi:rhodanese-like domain-containing protein [Prevotella falsenii]|uniref:rhodanese-like domain-containing protein n=1 Tax=Prevotella falsenii TaxID=515414 RepID=UPI00046828D0|nr:rhodanese-like domain-containing protein [Prevotella falsenii]
MKNILKNSIKVSIILCALVGFVACNSPKAAIGNVDVSQFEKIIQKGNVQIVDVRTEKEYKEGYIKDAQNIDVLQESFAATAKQKLDRSKPVAVYCRSGRRSAQACEILKASGFKTYNLLGGILEWKSKGKSIEQ